MAEEDKKAEDLLSEWQDMAAGEDEDGAPADGVVNERILDQNEIDSLLGIDADGEGNKSGLQALIETNIVNYEKLPMLDHIFDKFERFLSTSLRHFTADNVDVTVSGMTSVRFGEYLNSVPLPAGLVVVNAQGLDDYILVVYESKLIYAVVDILLGGRKSKPARIEGRSFTNIERSIMDNLTEVVLHELSAAFQQVAPIQFKAERMEVNPRFAVITREANAAILVSVRVTLEEREGIVQFCLPYATLEPVRDQMLQGFMGEKHGQDNIWENHLAQELYRTNVSVDAVLDEMHFSLSDVLEWKLGDTIGINANQNSPIQLNCGFRHKMVGSMGKVGNFKGIKIHKTITDVNNEEEDV